MKSSKFALLSIFLIVAIDILGLTIVLPLLPFYAERYGASPQTVGYLVTVYAFCQLLSGPLLGRLSDSTGRKPMLILSQIGTCAGFVILARSQALWMIFLARFVDGITAGNLPIAQATISDVTEPKDRAKAFGIIGIAFGIGFFIGPGISGYLSQFGYAAPAWAAAGLSFLSIVSTYFLLPDVRHNLLETEEEAVLAPAGVRKSPFDLGLFLKYFRQPALRELLLEFFCFGLGFSLFMSGFALFAERRFLYQGRPFGAREVGYFYMYLGFFGIFIQGYLLGKLVKRFGESKLVVSGFLTQMVGYGCLAFIHRIPFLLGISAVSAYGMGVLRPALTSLVSQRASRKEQGAVMGVSQSLTSIAMVLAPMLAGFLINRHWLVAWALAASGASFGGLLLAGIMPRFAPVAVTPDSGLEEV